MIHCRPETEAFRSRRMAGSAMFTIVLSRPTMNRLMQQMARTSIRRRGLSTEADEGGAGARLVICI
ncbi:hypothetical protein GCM10022419_055620 [Nonomuraea rosea]|uniref:Uncharacterized protein n=1 Tax=Nonomuraea rosea TaxID=638574 RepID=A0ABP6XJC6_9ACTN